MCCGPSGAGKSTVARLLARRHGLRWYSGDTRTWDHRDRTLRANDPDALRLEALTPEQRAGLPFAQRRVLDLVPGPLHGESGRLFVVSVGALAVSR